MALHMGTVVTLCPSLRKPRDGADLPSPACHFSFSKRVILTGLPGILHPQLMSLGSHLGMLAVDRSRRCSAPGCGFHPLIGGNLCERHLRQLRGDAPPPPTSTIGPTGASAIAAFLDQAAQPSKGLRLPNLAVANPGFSSFSGAGKTAFINGAATAFPAVLPLVTNLLPGGAVAPFNRDNLNITISSLFTLTFDAPNYQIPEGAKVPVWHNLKIPFVQVLPLLPDDLADIPAVSLEFLLSSIYTLKDTPAKRPLSAQTA